MDTGPGILWNWSGTGLGTVWNEVWNRIQKWRDPKSDADADAIRGGHWFFYLQSRFGVDALQVVFQRRSPRPRVILVDLIPFILDHVSKMGDPSCRNILERGSVWIVSWVGVDPDVNGTA